MKKLISITIDTNTHQVLKDYISNLQKQGFNTNLSTLFEQLAIKHLNDNLPKNTDYSYFNYKNQCHKSKNIKDENKPKLEIEEKKEFLI